MNTQKRSYTQELAQRVHTDTIKQTETQLYIDAYVQILKDTQMSIHTPVLTSTPNTKIQELDKIIETPGDFACFVLRHINLIGHLMPNQVKENKSEKKFKGEVLGINDKL